MSLFQGIAISIRIHLLLLLLVKMFVFRMRFTFSFSVIVDFGCSYDLFALSRPYTLHSSKVILRAIFSWSLSVLALYQLGKATDKVLYTLLSYFLESLVALQRSTSFFYNPFLNHLSFPPLRFLVQILHARNFLGIIFLIVDSLPIICQRFFLHNDVSFSAKFTPDYSVSTHVKKHILVLRTGKRHLPSVRGR